MIYLQLFWSFLQIGMFSVGGGYAAIPLIQEQVVEKHAWLTMDSFSDLVTIAEMTPGPIAVNAATFAGSRVAGFAGSVIATLGCIFPSLIILSVLAILYDRCRKGNTMRSILESLRPAVVALIASAGVTLFFQAVCSGVLTAANWSWQGFLLFAGAFFALRKLKWNPILVMALCGGVNLLLGILL